MENHPPKLLDQVRQLLRQQHYSLRTEKAYLGWITGVAQIVRKTPFIYSHSQ